MKRFRRAGYSIPAALAAVLAFIGTGIESPSAAAASSHVAVVETEADGTAAPLGIDDPHPQLSWQLASTSRGVTQTKYHLSVATSAETLRKGRPDVWQTTVRSSDTAVTYEGPALKSRTRYYWSVEAWTNTTAGSTVSAPAWFETAYMNTVDWKGSWISGPERTPGLLTDAQATADDSCCQQINTTLAQDTPAGSTSIKVASSTGITPGARLTVGTDHTAQKVSVAAVGDSVEVTPALKRDHAAGVALVGEEPKDFCRPSNGSPKSGTCKEIRPAPLLRKSFRIAPESEHGTVVSARVYASGLGWNEMTLNGGKTDPEGFLNPGFTSYDKTVQYTVDDVTKLIRQNKKSTADNVIASQLGSGRYDSEATSGNHGWERAEWRANPTLKADLWVTYADGTEQVVKSDTSWKTTDAGPIRYDNFDLGETYDARKEIPGWDTTGAHVSAWSAARAVTGPTGTLVAQKSDRTRKVADWPAGTRTEPADRVYVWDTGQQRTGWATVSISGAPASTPIQIRYAEKLGTDGLVSISGYAPAGQIQTDYYIAKGTGTAKHPESFAPRFTFNGFQYVQISGVGGKPLPDGVTATVKSVQEVRTDLPETGTFTSSSALLNNIYKATKASVAGTHEAGYIMDTPTYEKDGWTGDSQLMAPTASYIFDTQRQYQKTAQDLVDDQFPNGEISLLTPGNGLYGYSTSGTFKPAGAKSTPIWDALLFVAPWESYEQYGDAKPLKTAYPSMKKYLTDWIPQWFQADNDGYDFTLTSGLGDWDVPTGKDAPAGSATSVNVPRVIAPSSTAYVAYMAKITADAARALGKPTEAAQFDELFANIKADYNAKWWDASVGYYREDSAQIFAQTNQALPLAFGLVPDDRKTALQEKLVNDVLVTREGHQEVGIAGSRWIYPVLTQAAHDGVTDAAKAAYTIAIQTTYPSYGYWQSLGWTGLGEYWESTSRTRNHEMFGSIGQWMYEDLAGIQATAPGYKEVAIKPLISAGQGIDNVSATYKSVNGKISSSWSQNASRITLKVTIPANTTAKVYVPAGNPAAVQESGTGKTYIAAKAPGVKLTSTQGDTVVYTVGSGTYTFTAPVNR
ncbi:family 78 glycoside hydrolase catalytic domain [Actinacidiphila glaucinigra]|uniref:family 78 glycoside hydrolase catalytic domain n=1 Tax=Actinacidiphila glaucinigra TaxID=235986 RepID=UPI0035D73FEA